MVQAMDGLIVRKVADRLDFLLLTGPNGQATTGLYNVIGLALAVLVHGECRAMLELRSQMHQW